MSRIRGNEIKVKKEIIHYVNVFEKQNESETASVKHDVEKDQVQDLLSKIPKLSKTFNIHRKIGEGTFSSVYLGSMLQHATAPEADRKMFAIKHLVPTTHPSRVAHELRCLREIGGRNHVIGVEMCLRHLDNVVFIMPHIQHNKFSEYVGDMDADELRRYMRALLTALRHVHSFDVIHRDVKPSNFLYDRARGRYALVDFGLAQHMVPAPSPAQPPPAHQKRPLDDDSPLPFAKRIDVTGRRASPLPFTPRSPQPSHTCQKYPGPAGEVSASAARLRAQCACAGAGGACDACAAWPQPRANRAGTQGFRPPEVFFKYPHQCTAVDVWAAGVILVSLLTGKYPFFRPEDDITALAEIVAFCGTKAMKRTATALGCRLVASTSTPGTCLRKLSRHLREPGPDRAAGLRPSCELCNFHYLPCICYDDTTPAHQIDPTRSIAGFPDAAFALAACLLEPDPRRRITAAAALNHPFFVDADNLPL